MYCKTVKRGLIFLVLAGIILSPLAYAAPADAAIQILIDGNPLVTEVPPYIQDSNLMLPVRAVIEGLGGTVDNPPGTQLITGQKGDTTIQMEVGSPDAAINGHTYGLPVPVQVINNRTLAPVRFIAEAMNCYVSWDQEAQTALILSGEKDWNGYPSTPDAVIAAIIIAHGQNRGDVLEKYYYTPQGDGTAGEPFYSSLRITKIQELGAENEFEYSTAQSISQQVGLPCKAFKAEWTFGLTSYAESIGYNRTGPDTIGWFYMVQIADGTWKAQTALATGP